MASVFVAWGVAVSLTGGCHDTTGTADAGTTDRDGAQGQDATSTDGSAQLADLLPPSDMLRPSRAVLINFDDRSGTVTNEYQADATFSTTPGGNNVTLSFADYFNSSKPNILCGTGSCAEPTNVDFTKPASNLTFLSVGVNNTGKVADINVFVRGTKAATVPLNGVGMVTTPVLVDLSAYSDITRIEIVNITDVQGIGYDDFRFLTY